MNKKYIAISSGDINGIGLEVILKSIPSMQKHATYKPVLFCHKSIIEEYVKLINWNVPFEINEITDVLEWQDRKINCIAPNCESVSIELGKITAISGAYAMASIKSATESVLAGQTKALVTAPISKEAIYLAGY
jgi:4-hydroxy-L-threonine phosphate dehydrogenase PdxA